MAYQHQHSPPMVAKPVFPSQDHFCPVCSKSVSLDRSILFRIEGCTCAEEVVPSTPESASVTDYCVEGGAPCTPAGASVTGFSPFIMQSSEWVESDQRSMHTSPYSHCQPEKDDHSYSYTPGSPPVANTPRTSIIRKGYLDDAQSIPFLRSLTSNVLSLKELAEIPPDEVDIVSTGPEDVPGNRFIPLAPALGLGELQHRRRASLDFLESQVVDVNYSVRRYLDSLTPIGRMQTRQNDLNGAWLRQDAYLIPPSPQATEGSPRMHSRSQSLQSVSHKSYASGWVGLDPAMGAGQWMEEDPQVGHPMIIDEDSVLDEVNCAAHLAALKDREQHEGLIAQRNRLINHWSPGEPPSQPESEKNSVSSSDMPQDALAEEAYSPSFIGCDDEQETYKKHLKVIPTRAAHFGVTDDMATFYSAINQAEKAKISAIPAGTTYASAQNDSSNYTTEDSVEDDTSAYSQSNDSSGASEALGDTTYEGLISHENRVSVAVVETAKCALINYLMQEFWGLFDRDWTEKFTACVVSEPTTTSPSGQIAPTSAHGAIQKRQRQEDTDDNSSSDGNGRAPKRSIPHQTPPDVVGQGLALSCPFRKHDPRKYRFPEHRTCALSYWKNVGRVKEHIYRNHRVPIHCTRCWMVFLSENLLTSHSREEVSRCEVQPKQIFDGITPETERLLRSRKKEYRGQSEPELWMKMYRILFPDELVPSPYYEPIRDESTDLPHVQERAGFEEYCRRELPRFVRSRLESAVNPQLQALESALRSQLDQIIRDGIDQLSMNYETVRAIAATPGSNRTAVALRTPIAIRTHIPSTPAEVHRSRQQHNSIDSVPELQPAPEYSTSHNQSPGPPPTPGDSALLYMHYQASGMPSKAKGYANQESVVVNSSISPDCFCLSNSCNCPSQQVGNQFLPPSAFELNTSGMILERAPLPKEWTSEDLLVRDGLGSDEFNVSWDS